VDLVLFLGAMDMECGWCGDLKIITMKKMDENCENEKFVQLRG